MVVFYFPPLKKTEGMDGLCLPHLLQQLQAGAFWGAD